MDNPDGQTGMLPSDIVAEMIRFHRADRGWTRKRLAEECDRVVRHGPYPHPVRVTDRVLKRIEEREQDRGGRRRLVVWEELLVIAAAFSVPPICLMCPYPQRAETVALPGMAPMPSHAVWDWLSGTCHDVGPHVPDVVDGGTYWRYSHPGILVHFYFLLVQMRQIGTLDIIRHTKEADGASGPHAGYARIKEQLLRHRLDELDTDIVTVRHHMRLCHYPLPPLPVDLMFLDDREPNQKAYLHPMGTWLPDGPALMENRVF